jgi:hypothetical protein
MTRAAERAAPAPIPYRTLEPDLQTGTSHCAPVNFSATATLRKWPSIGNERAKVTSWPEPYLLLEGSLDACIRAFLAKPVHQRHLYEIHTEPQTQLVTAVLSAEQIIEIARLRDFL